MTEREPELLTRSEFARRVGVRPQTIMNHVIAGLFEGVQRTVSNGSVKLIWPAALGVWTKREEAKTKTGPRNNVAGLAGKLKKEKFDADLKELEFKRRSGELADVEEVKTDAFNTARRVRDAFQILPTRICDELAGMTDSRQVRRKLEDEIQLILEELSKGKYSND